jgi:hypothetical protein
MNHPGDDLLPAGVHGAFDPRFATAVRAFAKLFPGPRSGGGALAVYLHGHRVVDAPGPGGWPGHRTRGQNSVAGEFVRSSQTHGRNQASPSTNTRSGVRQLRIFRGRLLSSFSARARSSGVQIERSLPFGRNWRRRPLVFSEPPT